MRYKAPIINLPLIYNQKNVSDHNFHGKLIAYQRRGNEEKEPMSYEF